MTDSQKKEIYEKAKELDIDPYFLAVSINTISKNKNATDDILEDQIIIDVVKYSYDNSPPGFNNFQNTNPEIFKEQFKNLPDHIKRLLGAIAGNGQIAGLHYYMLTHILEEVESYKNRIPGKSLYKLINDKCIQLVDEASRISLTIGKTFSDS